MLQLSPGVKAGPDRLLVPSHLTFRVGTLSHSSLVHTNKSI